MDSDPPLVGSSCDHEDCNTNDFLPTKCTACSKLFCSIHYFPEAHGCPRFETVVSIPQQESVVSCRLEGCRTPCLESYASQSAAPGQEFRVAATCPRCSLSFCSEHRFPDTHHCEAPVLNSTAKNEAARAVLAKNFPSHHMEKKPVVKRPSELNAKSRPKSKGSELVQLMRMRQTAIPGDPSTGHVDIQNRFHLRVKIDKSNEYRAFWFRKSISTGKALDLLQRRLEVSCSKTWALLEDSDDSTEISTTLTAFDRPLSEILTDGCRLTAVDP